MYQNHFRMDRAAFHELLQIVRKALPSTKRYNIKIPPSIRLAVTLSKLAHNEPDRKVGALFGVPEGTVNTLFHEGLWALRRLAHPRFLPRVTPDRVRAAMDMWSAVGAPPGCFGAMDGIQFKFIRHGGALTDYWNYKHRTYCLGALAVALPDLRFLYFYSGTPGCMNDHSIWNECSLGRAFRDQEGPLAAVFDAVGIKEILPGVGTIPWMFGDGGFALRPWLVHPLREEATPEDRQFNKWISGHRQTVERAFGVLVGRWGILRKGGIHHDHQTANRIIQVRVCHDGRPANACCG